MILNWILVFSNHEEKSKIVTMNCTLTESSYPGFRFNYIECCIFVTDTRHYGPIQFSKQQLDDKVVLVFINVEQVTKCSKLECIMSCTICTECPPRKRYVLTPPTADLFVQTVCPDHEDEVAIGYLNCSNRLDVVSAKWTSEDFVHISVGSA
ncbi:hypothetical protein KIN20_011617 [Parelaphostrongylus tenuis]|uniref:Uncharacterized protein n=1 Tax=Parelaphostrongylus tenuis TaxID=148309 RepID=A0AAD5QPZ8_PARTN|nr:hypothetical protein KIN20_011617 [Parelaphostrongylus tenuis]